MTNDELMDLIAKAKQLGLKSLKVGDMYLEFHPDTTEKPETVPTSVAKPQAEEIPDLTANDLVAPPSPYDQLSDQEILFWSSDYGVELERQRQQDRINDELRKQSIADRQQE